MGLGAPASGVAPGTTRATGGSRTATTVTRTATTCTTGTWRLPS
nr:MAG TPA: hypothetical protein [Caudoviricetes sp.]